MTYKSTVLEPAFIHASMIFMFFRSRRFVLQNVFLSQNSKNMQQ